MPRRRWRSRVSIAGWALRGRRAGGDRKHESAGMKPAGRKAPRATLQRAVEWNSRRLRPAGWTGPRHTSGVVAAGRFGLVWGSERASAKRAHLASIDYPGVAAGLASGLQTSELFIRVGHRRRLHNGSPGGRPYWEGVRRRRVSGRARPHAIGASRQCWKCGWLSGKGWRPARLGRCRHGPKFHRM